MNFLPCQVRSSKRLIRLTTVFNEYKVFDLSRAANKTLIAKCLYLLNQSIVHKSL